MSSMRIRRLSLAVIIVGQIFFAGLLAAGDSTHPPPSDSPRIRADAFVAGSWNGIAFVVDDATGFQVRVGARTEGSDLLDGDHVGGFLTGIEDLLNGKPGPERNAHPPSPAQNIPVFYESVTEVGPHAPDGSYARLVWNPLSPFDTGSRIRLEWSRLDSSTLLGKITYEAPFGSTNYMSRDRSADIFLEAYSPLGFQAKYRVDNRAVVGSSEYQQANWEIEWDRWRFNFSSSNAHLPHREEPGFRSGFSIPSADDSRWKVVRWGAYWQESPLFIKSPGYGWYRTCFVIPQRLKGKALRVDLGKISQNDWTYLNGELIGNTSGGDNRAYWIAPGTRLYEKINWGARNTIAVQVQSAADLGGISAGPYIKAVRPFPPPRPRVGAFALVKQKVNFVLVTSKPPDSAGAFPNLEELRKQLQEDAFPEKPSGDACAGLLFQDLHMENFRRTRDNQLYFLIKVGSKPDVALLRDAQNTLARLDPAGEIETRRIAYEAQRVRADGGLTGAAEMLTNTVHWNVLYSTEQKRSFVVDSRRWFLPDSWTLFGNSAILSAWAAALESKQLAEDTFKATMAEQLPDGRVMNAAGAMVTTPDRSQDMYAAYVAWKIYLKWGDRQFLRDVYPRIKAWHEWWFADRGDGQPWRDGNHDGLLELGNNLSPFDATQAASDSEEYGLHHQAAMWEAFDDSPMWGWYQKGLSVHPPRYRGEANVQYIFRTGTLNLDTAPTNALWALNSDMLARIANELGYPQEERRFQLEYQQIKKRINETLWDEKTGMYLNRFWPEAGGNFSYRKSPALLWMMAAGIPSEAQAHRLVYEHLLNPKEFWGDFLLPSVSRDDPAFPEQYYWRGTIWPPVNYFVYEGLKRYGYDDVAAELAEQTYRLVKTNWDKTGALWENYNSITGEGNAHGAGGSTKHYAWSAALPLIAIMECIDQEAWQRGLRFGSIGLTRQSGIQNFTIQGHRYSVSAGPDLTELWRDAVRLFSTDTAAVIREFKWSPEHATFKIKLSSSAQGARITMGGLDTSEKKHAQIILDGNQRLAVQIPASEVVFNVPSGQHSIELAITK
jgi:glycogen debranching enzyme